MSDATILAEAARLIRERATKATPGPWFATVQSARYGGIVAAPTAGFPEHNGYGGHLIGESMSPANRDHAVGWHPAVAVAVADWLDSHAIDVAEADGDRACLGSPGDTDMALLVARTYLAGA